MKLNKSKIAIAAAILIPYNALMIINKTQQKTTELLDGYAAGRFPVPVIEIATSLGMRVLAGFDCPKDGNGHIEIDKEGNASIIVNDRPPPTRKKFTIAHEIAHFQYDMDYLKKHGSIDRNGNAADATYRNREKRANDFAAQLFNAGRAIHSAVAGSCFTGKGCGLF